MGSKDLKGYRSVIDSEGFIENVCGGRVEDYK